ncbi:hypothetical protein [Streptomyces sp. NBC_00385]|uniref:hypothetical protein n=1 Tax=Streptomyces sp. NBC_00385 TaxID=2975733 RepID=UPI002DDAA8E8|nr:hypothetical protein [Streptomyces sp. NBC_00385]WRZ04317.1 hypothetical protein OG959_13580 [Streptomyces sp. NBC_00385]
MRRGTTRALVAGWVVLAAAGWTTAQWLGEPTATSGPAPVTPPSSAAEPGPQPEYDCEELTASAKRSPGGTETVKRPPAVPESSPEATSPSAVPSPPLRVTPISDPPDPWNSADPSAGPTPPSEKYVPPDDRTTARLVQVICDTAEFTTEAEE